MIENPPMCFSPADIGSSPIRGAIAQRQADASVGNGCPFPTACKFSCAPGRTAGKFERNENSLPAGQAGLREFSPRRRTRRRLRIADEGAAAPSCIPGFMMGDLATGQRSARCKPAPHRHSVSLLHCDTGQVTSFQTCAAPDGRALVYAMGGRRVYAGIQMIPWTQ